MKNELHKLSKVSALLHMLVASISTNAPGKNTCFLLVNKDGIVSDENFKNCTFKTKNFFFLGLRPNASENENLQIFLITQ